jgi:hypothetical protein
MIEIISGVITTLFIVSTGFIISKCLCSAPINSDYIIISKTKYDALLDNKEIQAPPAYNSIVLSAPPQQQMQVPQSQMQVPQSQMQVPQPQPQSQPQMQLPIPSPPIPIPSPKIRTATMQTI